MPDAPANATTGAAAANPGAEAAAPTTDELLAKIEELKGHSRKWEDRAKENKEAADKLAELERAQMTEAQKAEADKRAATEALAAATKRAEDAEAELVRYKLAIELELSAEDAEALAKVQGDEATLRALAERLAGKKAPAAKPTGSQGRTTTGTPTAKDAFVAAMEGLIE